MPYHLATLQGLFQCLFVSALAVSVCFSNHIGIGFGFKVRMGVGWVHSSVRQEDCWGKMNPLPCHRKISGRSDVDSLQTVGALIPSGT
jgi:hypothetical protein